MSGILDELNPEQRQAVECIKGPVLIVAGAGSGKTRVLTSRIAYLIQQGTPPERILALTFTKKAAGEMKERIGRMVGERLARRLWMGTFHSVFIRFLREYAERLGFPASFTIYDTSDSVSAIKACIKELKLDEKNYKAKEVLGRISKAKNDLITPAAYAQGAGGFLEADKRGKRPDIYRIFALYMKHCRQSGVMDFDDILLYMNFLLRDHPDALEQIAARFDQILVDEYQDTNYAQYLILRKLSQGHGNLCVVGDDSQSIYGFRGARVENILHFQRDFPAARIFRLERNYRSTRNIVGAANSVIAQNEGRIPKTCVSVGEEGEKIRLVRSYTEQEEALQIASLILTRMRAEHLEYEDFAILYRTNSQSRALEEQLRKRNIPYMIFSGNSFYERAEVKDMMAYFKLAVNPSDDESFKRVVNKPARGIGDTTLQALELAAREGGTSLYQAVAREDLENFGLRAAAVTKLRSFCSMMARFTREVLEVDAHRVAVELASESGLYLFYKSDNSVEGQSRMANVQELLDSVAAYCEEMQADYRERMVEDGSVQDASAIPDNELPVILLADYLENISLLSNVDVADDETRNKVALMTVHSAKGLEFPYVIVSGMEENLFPSGGWMLSEKELEEERRLFYVALTRAERAVTLTYAQTRMRNGKHESNSPSRFLREIAPQFLVNPLRKEDMTSVSSPLEHDEAPFRFGSYRRSTPPQQPERPKGPSFASREEIKASIAARPKPPVTADASFVPDPMSSFKAGDSVEHNRFGRGRIVELSGIIPEIKAKIIFERFGEKLLLLKYAKIRHI